MKNATLGTKVIDPISVPFSISIKAITLLIAICLVQSIKKPIKNIDKHDVRPTTYVKFKFGDNFKELTR